MTHEFEHDPLDETLLLGHRSIERMLTLTRLQLDTLGGPTDVIGLAALGNAISHMRWSEGSAHHAAEKAIVKRLGETVPSAENFCRSQIEQHQTLHELEERIYSSIEAAKRGDEDAYQRLRDYIAEYCRLYSAHIELEESIILPLARRSLKAADWGRARECFDAAMAAMPAPRPKTSLDAGADLLLYSDPVLTIQ